MPKEMLLEGRGFDGWCRKLSLGEIPCMDIDLASHVWPLASFLQQDWEWERVAASEAERQGTSYSLTWNTDEYFERII